MKSRVMPESLFPLNYTGEVTLSMPLDREKTELYSLTVVASDLGGLSDFMRLEVIVTDVNDNAPVIEQTAYEVSYFLSSSPILLYFLQVVGLRCFHTTSY